MLISGKSLLASPPVNWIQGLIVFRNDNAAVIQWVMNNAKQFRAVS